MTTTVAAPETPYCPHVWFVPTLLGHCYHAHWKGRADSALPSCFLLIFRRIRSIAVIFQSLPKNERHTFWKNAKNYGPPYSVFRVLSPKFRTCVFRRTDAIAEWCGGVLTPPSHRLAGPALRRPGAWGAAPAGCWGRRPVKVTDSQRRRPGGPTSSGPWPADRRRGPLKTKKATYRDGFRELTAAVAARLARSSYSVDLC